jgi:hypothetical protein
MQLLNIFLALIGFVRDMPGAVLNRLTQTVTYVPVPVWALAAVLAVVTTVAVLRTKPASR